eukprot:scaffold2184_cov128-Cylindrotheca_fusiformis.AAC.1
MIYIYSQLHRGEASIEASPSVQERQLPLIYRRSEQKNGESTTSTPGRIRARESRYMSSKC